MENIKIDEKKIKMMLIRILGLERKNAKTKEFSDPQMITEIQNIIEEEVRCL